MKKLIYIGIIFNFLGFCTNSEQCQAQNESVNLYAFIGEKISVTEFKTQDEVEYIIGLDGDTAKIVNLNMDRGFEAQYRVIINVYNKLKSDTVNFIAFDHYGRPAFENHQYVLLYLSWDDEDSTYYHQKYQFDAVRKTKKGSWKGLKGKNINKLFEEKKNGVFTNRGLF